MTNTKSRNGAIDLLRFIFTMYVVICHSYTTYGIDYKHPANGWYSVEFFFVLSGFLMAASCEKYRVENSRDLWKASYVIIKRKITGLYPVWFTSFLCFAIFHIKDNCKTISDIFRFLFESAASLFMLSDLGLPSGITIPYSWFVPTSLLTMFLLVPLVCYNRKNFTYCIAPIISIFGFCWLWNRYGHVIAYEQDWLGVTYSKTIRSVTEFSVGCMSYELSIQLRQHLEDKLNHKGKLLMTVAGLSAVGIPLYWMTILLRRNVQILGVVLFGIGIAFIFSDTGYFRKIFQHSLFNWLGKFSFSLYLGQGIPQLLIGHIYGRMPTIYFEITYILIALLAGLFIHYTSGLLTQLWKKIVMNVKNEILISSDRYRCVHAEKTIVPPPPDAAANLSNRKRKEKIVELDFIRAICAIGIIIFHIQCHTSKDAVKILYNYANGNWGTALVGIFLIVSGGVIYYNYQEITSLRHFYYKRWKTLFPMFYVAYLHCYIERALAAKQLFYKGHPISFLLTILGLDGYFNYRTTTYYILGEWFLGAIVMLYVISPILIKLLKNHGIAIYIFWIFLWVWQFETNIFQIAAFKNMIHCCGLFLTGMIVFKYELYKKRILTIPASILCIVLLFIPINGFAKYREVIFIICLFLTLFCIGKVAMKFSFSKCISFVSQLSYPIFLVQHIIDMKLVAQFNPLGYAEVAKVIIISILLCILYGWYVSIIAKAIMNTSWFQQLEKFILNLDSSHSK